MAGRKHVEPGHVHTPAKRALPSGAGHGGRPWSWRRTIRGIVGDDLGDIWRAMKSIAEGQPLICKGLNSEGKPDGTVKMIVPTAADAVRAGTEILHMILGRPVDQSQILAAELAEAASGAVSRLSDAELEQELRARFSSAAERVVNAIPEQPRAIPPTVRRRDASGTTVEITGLVDDTEDT